MQRDFSTTTNHRDEYTVMLPCSPEDFGGFVGSLLGKPQTIERSIFGEFEFTKEQLINLFHLVEQRVHQQNRATLIQFVARISYSDNSSVQLNSFDDFIAYTEVHPKLSVGVNLTWIYLVQFLQESAPEKQSIDLTIGRTSQQKYWTIPESLPESRLIISHTERSWGIDMESLISGNLQNYIRVPTGRRLLIIRTKRRISLIAPLLLVFGGIFGVWRAINTLAAEQLAIAKRLTAEAATGSQQVIERMDFLIQIIASGTWSKFTLGASGFVIGSILISIFFGVVLDMNMKNRYRQFILLTEQSKMHRSEVLAEEKTDTLIAALSVIGSVCIGILSNIVYTKYFSSI